MATVQELVLEVANVIKTRALRLGYPLTTQEPAVFIANTGKDLSAVPAGEVWLIVKLKTETVEALGEKLSGITNKTGVIPS